jgi:hypothetical protein
MCDFAEVHILLVNYEDLAQTILKPRRGCLGEVSDCLEPSS